MANRVICSACKSVLWVKEKIFLKNLKKSKNRLQRKKSSNKSIESITYSIFIVVALYFYELQCSIYRYFTDFLKLQCNYSKHMFTNKC